MNILSYNVNFAIGRRMQGDEVIVGEQEEVILRAIEEAEADIIMLQETHVNWETMVRARVGHGYPYQYWWHDNAAAGGSGLLSRWPLSQEHVLALPDEVRGSWFEPMLAVVTVPPLEPELPLGVTLLLANVHLRPPVNPGGSAHPLTMRWTSPIRREEVGLIHAKLMRMAEEHERGDVGRGEAAAPFAAVIGGDWNESDGHSACAFAHSLGLRDALRLYKGHTHWWPLRIPGGFTYTLRHRLDHVFYDASVLRATACRILPGYEGNASDHLPLVARLAGAEGEEGDGVGGEGVASSSSCVVM